jgi:hypothetical protein
VVVGVSAWDDVRGSSTASGALGHGHAVLDGVRSVYGDRDVAHHLGHAGQYGHGYLLY